MKLLLDEDVSVVIGAILRSRNLDVVSVHDVHREGLSDETQLLFAAAAGRCFVTHNRNDFIRLDQQFRSSGRSHAGIVVAVRRSPHKVVELLHGLYARFGEDEIANQVWYI